MGEDYNRLLTKVGWILADHKIRQIELPWRKHRTPYRIFLAEMLLVRTRVDVVAEQFEKIYSQVPTIDALATIDFHKAQEIFRPLGLTKRIPYLINAARYIQQEHNGEIPSDYNELLKVPGIGRYTATAILSFAYGFETVPADVNILRFISRITGLEMKHKTKGSKELVALASSLTRTNTGLSAEELLDFTRLICRARKPKCAECPVSGMCTFHKKTF